jgi:hypothetical protein
MAPRTEPQAAGEVVVPGPPGKPGPPGAPGAPGRTVAAAVVTTGPDGRATWSPDPEHGPLVVAAVPVVSPASPGPYTVAIGEAGAGRVSVWVWCMVPHGRGVRWVPAGEGVAVHVTGSLPDEAAAVGD